MSKLTATRALSQLPGLLGLHLPDAARGEFDRVLNDDTADSRRHDPPFSETGSWKLEVGLVNFFHWLRKRLVDLGTEKAPGSKLAKSNFQLPTSNFLFLKTEGHVFSNPLYHDDDEVC